MSKFSLATPLPAYMSHTMQPPPPGAQFLDSKMSNFCSRDAPTSNGPLPIDMSAFASQLQSRIDVTQALNKHNYKQRSRSPFPAKQISRCQSPRCGSPYCSRSSPRRVCSNASAVFMMTTTFNDKGPLECGGPAHLGAGSPLRRSCGYGPNGDSSLLPIDGLSMVHEEHQYKVSCSSCGRSHQVTIAHPHKDASNLGPHHEVFRTSQVAPLHESKPPASNLMNVTNSYVSPGSRNGLTRSEMKFGLDKQVHSNRVNMKNSVQDMNQCPTHVHHSDSNSFQGDMRGIPEMRVEIRPKPICRNFDNDQEFCMPVAGIDFDEKPLRDDTPSASDTICTKCTRSAETLRSSKVTISTMDNSSMTNKKRRKSHNVATNSTSCSCSDDFDDKKLNDCLTKKQSKAVQHDTDSSEFIGNSIAPIVNTTSNHTQTSETRIIQTKDLDHLNLQNPDYIDPNEPLITALIDCCDSSEMCDNPGCDGAGDQKRKKRKGCTVS